MRMLGEDDKTSGNFGLHKDEKPILKKQNMEEDHRDLVSENSETGRHVRNMLSRRFP